MSTTTKIIIVTLGVLLALGFDQLSYRIQRLQYAEERHRRKMEELEKKLDVNSTRIDPLEKQFGTMYGKTLLVYPLASETYLMRQRFNVLNDLFAKKVLSGQGIKIFRNSGGIEDATIGSQPSFPESEGGRRTELYLGGNSKQVIYRSLLKFQQTSSGVLAGKKILNAIVYLQQDDTNPPNRDDGAGRETINVYAVKKKWRDSGVSWSMTQTDGEAWSLPGASQVDEDVKSVILATSGPVVSGGATGWVACVFTLEGIAQLQDWVNGQGKDDHGFLLKLNEGELNANSVLSFTSSENISPARHPYIEIYYHD